MKKCLIVAVLLGVMVGVTRSQEMPFQLSLVPSGAICPQTEDVTGLALNLWGSNEQHAFAIGVINGTFGRSGGLCIGGFNYSTGTYQGGQIGLVNIATESYAGGQVALINYACDELTGFQGGLFNYAGRLDGFQFGLINMAPQMVAGLQIGIVNLIVENRQWFAGLPNELAPAMIIFNWKF
jgi:hypothetical protein